MAPRKRHLLDDPPSASSSDDSFKDSSSESESEEEEEQQQQPASPSTPISNPKHAAAESEHAAPKLKLKSGTKRPAVNNNTNGNSKRSKKQKTTGESSNKSSTRVFSEKDDIIILENISVFISETGNNPRKKVKEFLNFVKKFLSIEVNYEQMKRKLGRLEDKYIRDMYKGKDIEDFTAPNEKKVFELSKKIWGNICVNKAEENRKVPMAAKEDATGIAHENLVLSEVFRFGDAVGLSHFMKKGFELVEESKRQSMEDEWRHIKTEEMEVFGQRAELLKDRANLILQALNKSSQ